MAKYVISQKAIDDLDGIWDYTLNTWSEEQAVKYYNSIRQSVIDLADNPGVISRSFERIRHGLMGYKVGHHIVFYIKRRDGYIRVVRILHEKMDYARHFNQ